MNVLEYGKENGKSILFVHGMASTALLCYEPLLAYLKDYHVILVELDGHSDTVNDTFTTIDQQCEEIEAWVNTHMNGTVDCLSGFSLGAAICVRLLERRNISAGKVLLDAPFTVHMGMKRFVFRPLFSKGILLMQKNVWIPKSVIYSMMGEGNDSSREILNQTVSQKSLRNACTEVYTYRIRKSLAAYENPVFVWYGEYEPYPKQSAELLKTYLPQLVTEEFPHMGHGQFLHEHPHAYAEKLIEFIKS